MQNLLFSLLLTILAGLGLSYNALHAANDAMQPAHISHAPWHAQLQKYVSATGSVNYAAWKRDEATLDAYLKSLSAQAPGADWTRNEQMTFWINAYNAFTVKLILKNYPLKSITDLKDPWDQKFITIGGRSLSLNDIEHEILRKQFADPRIHFAVNCASKSCPVLLNQAFSADKLDSQLDAQARAFINDSKLNRLAANKAELSEIFNWYRSDFEQNGSTLIAFINRYASTKLQAAAAISHLPYDWSLNGR
ncbi:MAG: DUF547 domain-containing protein [Bacteroidia bacterium]